MQLQAKELIINKLRISYYERTGGNLAVLFLHGWRSNGLVWQNIIKGLSAGITCLSLDLPGFGRSELPPWDADVSFYASVVEELIRKLRHEKIIIIGHSFGGRIAVKIAASNPSYLQNIVLVNAAGKSFKSPYRTFLKGFSAVLRPLFRLHFMQPLRKIIYKIIDSEDYLSTPALQKVFQNTINEDLTPLLPQIKVPSLVVWGSQDREVPQEFAQSLCSKIPNVICKEFHGAGHWTFLEFEKEFIDLLKNFIND